MKEGGLVFSLVLFLVVLAQPVAAAELSGTVFSQGAPVASQAITVEGRGDIRTDANGQYKIDLPPGDYTLVIRGKQFPVTVAPAGTKKDIRF